MNPHQQFIKPPTYKFPRQVSPPSNLNSTQSTKMLSLTIGAHQTPSSFFQNLKKTQNPNLNNRSFDNLSITQLTQYQKLQKELKRIHKQNLTLKEENDKLKRQFNKCKRQNLQTPKSKQKSIISDKDNDLRNTIKKENSQIKQLKLKLHLSEKQIKIYQQINEKLEKRSQKMQAQLKQKDGLIQKLKIQVEKMDIIKKKVNSIMEMYNDVESKYVNHSIQWVKWKQNWAIEKDCYLKQIDRLKKCL